MKRDDFDYELPAGRIAAEPAERRDDARLMVLDGAAGEPKDSVVRDLPEILRAGDLLVVNDTRVFPARLRGRKDSGGAVEALLLRRLSAEGESRERWRALVGASHAPRGGARMRFGDSLTARVVEPPASDGEAVLELEAATGSVSAAVEATGETPLPPYIPRGRSRGGQRPGEIDRERYQTVYAREGRSAAAPTAGLHFTPELLDRLGARGVRRAAITLEVGLGTFAPIKEADLSAHRLHSETFAIPAATVEAIAAARQSGGRIVAVGTTVVRTLEEAARRGSLDGPPRPLDGETALFITPGFEFRVIDVLMTNFHLPRSTLLVLAAAFAGRERLLAAYRTAVERGYRFYSYGDAMLLTRERAGAA